MELERLLPPGDPADPVELLGAERLHDHAPAGRPHVLANFVTTLDGRIELDGRSSALGGDADGAMFAALRTVADAVLAGTGTVAAEGYGRLARAPERRAARERLGLAPDPLMVLLTRSGEVPWDAPLFDAPEQPVVVCTRPGAVTVPEAVAAPVTVVELEDLSAATALAALRRDHGVRLLLCEGGPRLLAGLVAEDVLDELFLTVDPLLAGGEDVQRVLGGEALDPPARARLQAVLRGGDELLLRYALRTE